MEILSQRYIVGKPIIGTAWSLHKEAIVVTEGPPSLCNCLDAVLLLIEGLSEGLNDQKLSYLWFCPKQQLTPGADGVSSVPEFTQSLHSKC